MKRASRSYVLVAIAMTIACGEGTRLADSIVEVGADFPSGRRRCQGVAIEPSRVITAKHCVGTSMSVRLWGSGEWVPAVIRGVHPEMDVAVLDLSRRLPLSRQPTLSDRCLVGRPLVSACYPGRGASATLVWTRVAMRCSSAEQCFSRELELAPGASGCPLFDPDTGAAAALGVSSRRSDCRVVCLTRLMISSLVGSVAQRDGRESAPRP